MSNVLDTYTIGIDVFKNGALELTWPTREGNGLLSQLGNISCPFCWFLELHYKEILWEEVCTQIPCDNRHRLWRHQVSILLSQWATHTHENSSFQRKWGQTQGKSSNAWERCVISATGKTLFPWWHKLGLVTVYQSAPSHITFVVWIGSREAWGMLHEEISRVCSCLYSGVCKRRRKATVIRLLLCLLSLLFYS